jgi:hypothetical protein
MGSVTEFKQKEVQATTKPVLGDAVAAFTFSRLPREERIAAILFEVLKQLEGTLEINGPADLVETGKELAQYSVKDFAVRYGHLSDGKN